MNFLKQNLGHVLDEDNLIKQIKYYLYSQILIRSGGLIQDSSGDVYFNPFLKVKKGAKVVIYSSGSFGQHILSTNKKTNFFQVIKWIDVDYHDLNIGSNSVKPISSIANNEFDYLIIATINPTTHASIKTELALMGIDKNKIVKINTNEEDITNLLTHLGFNKDFKYVETN
jgi:hypothetical protein